ncbi:hypothetical protein GCM10025867_43170 [Frondihabitans sucicola]|uniref:Uncharacterized protein n=1 Tax=Frondihabitans sucicola TaxID=1268041 RepID=A0ABM8GUF0_9MICO|nr:hypothetical protein GCM10025867_43170 [Frondihabitans sucicola]
MTAAEERQRLRPHERLLPRSEVEWRRDVVVDDRRREADVDSPMAVEIALVPSKVTLAAYGMTRPVSFSMVSTAQARPCASSPPRPRAVFSIALSDAYEVPDAVGQEGIGISRSRGKLMTEMLLWSREMWMRMLTSLLPTPELAS